MGRHTCILINHWRANQCPSILWLHARNTVYIDNHITLITDVYLISITNIHHFECHFVPSPHNRILLSIGYSRFIAPYTWRPEQSAPSIHTLWYQQHQGLVTAIRMLAIWPEKYECFPGSPYSAHYNDVIMGTMASQITSLTIVYSTVYSDADQRKHQSSASLAFVRGIHRGLVNSPHKWTVTRKMFPFDDVIMILVKRKAKLISFDINTNSKLYILPWHLHISAMVSTCVIIGWRKAASN